MHVLRYQPVNRYEHFNVPKWLQLNFYDTLYQTVQIKGNLYCQRLSITSLQRFPKCTLRNPRDP